MMMVVVALAVRKMFIELILVFCLISCEKGIEDKRTGVQIEPFPFFRIQSGTEFEFFMVIKNNTNKTLLIEKFATSCSCIVLDSLNKLQISAYENDSVKLKLITTEKGQFTETFVVSHNHYGRFSKVKIGYEVF